MWGRAYKSPAVHGAAVMVCVVMAMMLKDSSPSNTQSAEERLRTAKEALIFVQTTTPENCESGTGTTLSLNFDKRSFIRYADPAIRTANMLSLILAMHNNTFDDTADETFFNMVRNNVHGETLIFGSATAFEEDVLKPPRTGFSPYAAQNPDGSVTAFDIATAYNYSTSVWYVPPSLKDYSDVKVLTDNVTLYTDKGEEHVQYRQPVANYSHGHWTKPYFDCGGGDIWMVTYLSPVLIVNDSLGTPVFRGVATVDLQLTDIDINQCDVDHDDDSDDNDDDDSQASLDVFRGTHNCQPTTRCVPIQHMGFRRGSYKCVCQDGFYFPDPDNELKAYKGTDIESFLDKETTASTAAEAFKCLPCARACETCVDNSPCLYQENIGIRIFVVIVIIVLLCCCAALSFITFKYRKDSVMKTASPSFLQAMIFGAVLMYLSVLLMFPEPTDTLCSVFQWPFHLGFGLLYGSLLIKTWRISVIFTSRRKVNLTDRVLMQRLLVIPALLAVYLLTWVLLDPPSVNTIVMPDTIKFFACTFTYWNYAAFGAEALMLLFGVYLSFIVRKAPAQFNESKYITWAIYNAIILGVFIITITEIMSYRTGPDVLFVLLLLQVQVFDTTALLLIFVPKLWALVTGTPAESEMMTMGPPTSTRSLALRTANGPNGPSNTMADVATQVEPKDFAQDDTRPATRHVPPSTLRSNRVAPLNCVPQSPKDVKTPTEEDL